MERKKEGRMRPSTFCILPCLCTRASFPCFQNGLMQTQRVVANMSGCEENEWLLEQLMAGFFKVSICMYVLMSCSGKKNGNIEFLFTRAS